MFDLNKKLKNKIKIILISNVDNTSSYYQQITNKYRMIGKKIILTLFLTCFAISLWEHIATESDYLYKPTYFLDQVTEAIRPCFRSLGVTLALMSSFLEFTRTQIQRFFKWLRIENYIVSVGRLMGSSGQLLASWIWIVFGFLDYLAPLTQTSTNITLLGSVILIVLILGLGYKCVYQRPCFKHFRDLMNNHFPLILSITLILSLGGLVSIWNYYTYQPVSEALSYGTLL